VVVPVASPLEVTVATAGIATVQLAVELTLAVELSLYVAVAVNCCEASTTMVALAGDTEIDVKAAVDAVTLSVADPLIPLSEAATVVEPAVTPVARPLEFIVATPGLATVQLAVELTLAVEPSLYVAVAVNCRVAPTATLGVDDATETDVSVLFGGGLLEEPPAHAVLAITSEREKRKAGMENNQRRGMAMYRISKKCDSAKSANIASKIATTGHRSATTSPTRRAARAETEFSCQILV
jgi:hypothetical protein